MNISDVERHERKQRGGLKMHFSLSFELLIILYCDAAASYMCFCYYSHSKV